MSWLSSVPCRDRRGARVLGILPTPLKRIFGLLLLGPSHCSTLAALVPNLFMLQVSEPVAEMVGNRNDDAINAYLQPGLTSTATYHKGMAMKEWMQLVNNGSATSGSLSMSRSSSVFGRPDTPVKVATGRMRPYDEWKPNPEFIPSGLSTFKPCGITPTKMSIQTNAAVDRLEAHLQDYDARAGGTGKITPNGIRSACQRVLLPIDDDDLTQSLRTLRADKNGKLDISDVISSFRDLAVKAERPAASLERLWDPAPICQLPPSKMLQAKTPVHPITAADYATIMATKEKLLTRSMEDECCSISSLVRAKSYDMIPSIANAVPHRSVKAQLRLLRDPERSQLQNISALEVGHELPFVHAPTSAHLDKAMAPTLRLRL